MARDWKQAIAELDRLSLEAIENCPDEIKCFHYGIMTHSNAGKDSYNQYFGHWVHSYVMYMNFAATEMTLIRTLAVDPDFNVVQLKKLFYAMAKPRGEEKLLREYTGAVHLADAIDIVDEALPSVTTNEQIGQLMAAMQGYCGQLYWWFQWYFPWGLGTICQRLSPDDIKEITRLGQRG